MQSFLSHIPFAGVKIVYSFQRDRRFGSWHELFYHECASQLHVNLIENVTYANHVHNRNAESDQINAHIAIRMVHDES